MGGQSEENKKVLTWCCGETGFWVWMHLKMHIKIIMHTVEFWEEAQAKFFSSSFLEDTGDRHLAHQPIPVQLQGSSTAVLVRLPWGNRTNRVAI